MTKLDTILIKIGQSYKEGMSAEDLYHATSVSWKIGESRLHSTDYKYYCAVYNNRIKEVYELTGYEEDLHPENIGRFILKGKLAEESLRSRLLDLDVGNIHKGSGNPIKYACMEDLLHMTESGNEKLFKHLFYKAAKYYDEVQTLKSKKSNWITKVDDEGLQVETIDSREKYKKGERNHSYDLISFDFLLEAWNEFISIKSAANDFKKTQGRSSFVMAFFSKFPFVEVIEKENNLSIKLKEFTTDQLPEASLEQTLGILNEIIHEHLDPRTISQKYSDDTAKRLKLRARQGLKILGFLSEEYLVQDPVIIEYMNSTNKHNFLSNKIKQSPYLSVIFDLLPILDGEPKSLKLSILSEIGMLLVKNSKGENQMVKSVAEYRTRNILGWFKETELVDQEWNLIGMSEPQPRKYNSLEIISHIDKYIANKGFYYEKDEIINLYLSLRTKPFVIISGISGTGKTMMVKWFAESLGARKDNGQFNLIPIRPDWSDGSDLLGYRDIKGEFIAGPLTKVLKKAHLNPSKPYFVLLDEMNLARVEYYFSDFLSVMESREWQNGELVTHSVLPEETMGQSLGIPENVYIIGTVNMDETTFPYSKKVLDRANTIEFNRVALDNFSFLEDNEMVDPIILNNSDIMGRFLHLKEAYHENMDIVRNVSSELEKINLILEKIGAQVGYRVRDELCFYMIYNENGGLLTNKEAFDFQILQKVLPRISGSDYRVLNVLKELFTYCTGNKVNEKNLDDLDKDIQSSGYPKSAKKLAEMIRRYNVDGFTSFWIGG
ncbi:AAA family ATPase [Neobacillus mesonae]|uniref:AAA family ATPase n=1 Tax=Neobacillus mesonae TaxID=1193713 RepID=UPI00203B9499|nr:AAA family ATPase [Neobacillus mesonae]MCM3570165.1 AAA family ATPase [Neobacillus mesonae]